MSLFFNEALEDSRLTRAAMRTRHIILGVVGALTLAAMAFVFLGIDRELDRSKSVNSDNVTWTMSQVEVDTLKLQRAVIQAAVAPDDAKRLDDLRLAFDIFYSRFNVLARSRELADLPINTQLRAALWAEGGFIDRVTPFIDSGDATLGAAVPRLADEMIKVAEDVRRTTTSSLQALMQRGDATRAELRRSLQIFAAASLGLLGLMGGLSVVIILQNRAQQRRSETTRRAVHNLRATIESSLDAVIIADNRGRVTDCNHAAEMLFKVSRVRSRGILFADLVSKEGFNDPLSTLHRMMRDGDDWSEIKDGRIQMMGHCTDGTQIPVEVAMAEAISAGGEPMYIAFIRDIRERIEREESLRNARNDALKGEEAKSRFLAVMSHEMRTPLNGLIAAAELMQSSTELDQRQMWLSEIVLSCGWAALDQVNNVLELTRLGSGQASSYPVAVFSPAQVVRDLILQNQPQANKRGNELVLEEPDGPLPAVSAPRQLFLRVLYNLIGNAIKFTDGGRVTVRMQHKLRDNGSRVHLVVSVIDTGIGIADHDLQRIFHNFETLDASYARMREGTGLGLGIAKLSAEAMGGEILVESQVGIGSTFTLDLTLPVAEGVETGSLILSPSTEPDDGGRNLNILVVEDNAINSLLLSEMLRMRGHTVANAGDGIEAVEQAGVTVFDLILMDISMPRMDGLEATRLIRADTPNAHVPIIGVTANASPDKLPEFLDAGMSDVLVKPITRGALMSIIEAHAGPGTPVIHAIVAPEEHQVIVLDHDVFVETVEEMGREFVERIAERLLSETALVIEQITQLAANGSLGDAGKAAHKTAGAAAAIGLKGLHGALAGYEKAALADDATSAGRALDEVRALLPLTITALRENGLVVHGAQTAAQ